MTTVAFILLVPHVRLLLAQVGATHWILTWAGFYLICFVVGFALTLITFLVGNLHFLPGHWHLHLGHHGHVHVHHGHLHTGSGTHPASTTELPIFNTFTVMAFLAWFGGTGYLLTHYGRVEVLLGFPIAVLGGIGGAAVIFYFMLKLMSFEGKHVVPDGDIVGAIGTVNIGIREGGTGEITFVLGHTRRVSGARADGAGPIDKGAEVVITRYEKGIAYVKPWQEFTGEESLESEVRQ
jgi:hypothetical protein